MNGKVVDGNFTCSLQMEKKDPGSRLEPGAPCFCSIGSNTERHGTFTSKARGRRGGSVALGITCVDGNERVIQNEMDDAKYISKTQID